MESPSLTALLPELRFDVAGLVPCIAQASGTGEVLMLAWMNEAALRRTLETGQVTYWSRSRQALWRKGETSGQQQRLVDLRVDCDGDTILLKVRQVGGAACHEGYPSCFFRQITAEGVQVVATRVFDPATVYKKPHE